ncbi:hypothetical protein IMAU10142_02074 [Lactobacillus helveticus]|jgi:hypothetical protein|uniref:Uncharacterized protein n=1 Tax=Lactobacillus helveticus TaxID=1587 RepID=A0AAC8W7B8_LACHE|nr:hypothetical protein [Lactobacillus helveticus]EGF35160.1 hypothetical protein AAULH_01502 [Lactobacillus helveticus MTCC 5463]AJY60862.1 hypothetical protein HUO_02270 [Lactobacillus helveticus]ALI51908.1 hypothetical protein ALV80_01305 [Lactobacillus helveticus]MBW7980877.1 hypothetical protein [Lactobacillus helveticus]MCT3406019.1 hypothetical protein [Lactobacillus helveticus]
MSDIYDAYVDPNYYTLNSPDHNVLRRVVVQKGNVASRYIYAEQYGIVNKIFTYFVLIRNLRFHLTKITLF